MARYLSEADHDLLQQFLAEYRKTRKIPTLRTRVNQYDPQQADQTPEMFIAKPQSAGGIPALTSGSPDVAGEADCDIYKIVESGGSPELVDSGLNNTVYNVSTTAVPQQYTPISRDKFGKWIADKPQMTSNETVTLVKVYHASRNTCDGKEDNAECVWDGRIVTADLSGTAAGAECGFPHTESTSIWITVVNQCPTEDILKVGEIYLASKVTNTYEGATEDTRPLYAIRQDPPHSAIVKLEDITGADSQGVHGVLETSGCSLGSDGAGFYPGYRIEIDHTDGQISDGCDLVEIERVWLYAVNFANHMQTLREQERYIGINVGYYISGANAWPVYAIQHHEQTPWRVASLAAGISLSGSRYLASANLASMDGTVTTSKVVEDRTGLFKRALTGATGLIQYVGDAQDSTNQTDAYTVWAMQQATFVVRMTLGADLRPADSTATVTTAGRKILTPAPHNQDVSSFGTVQNPMSLWGESGDPCIVQYNESDDNWELVEVSYTALRRQSWITATSSMSGTGVTDTVAGWSSPSTVGPSFVTLDSAGTGATEDFIFDEDCSCQVNAWGNLVIPLATHSRPLGPFKVTVNIELDTGAGFSVVETLEVSIATPGSGSTSLEQFNPFYISYSPRTFDTNDRIRFTSTFNTSVGSATSLDVEMQRVTFDWLGRKT